MTLMESKKRYYKKDKALEIVFILNSNEEEDWRFVAKDALKNLAFIEIYDEENEFVGYWDI